MKGVQFLVNENGEKTAVLIDLKKHSELWEDFYDVAVAKERDNEPLDDFEAVKKRLGSRLQSSFVSDIWKRLRDKAWPRPSIPKRRIKRPA